MTEKTFTKGTSVTFGPITGEPMVICSGIGGQIYTRPGHEFYIPTAEEIFARFEEVPGYQTVTVLK